MTAKWTMDNPLLGTNLSSITIDASIHLYIHRVGDLWLGETAALLPRCSGPAPIATLQQARKQLRERTITALRALANELENVSDEDGVS